jgi:hypothetical protein
VDLVQKMVKIDIAIDWQWGLAIRDCFPN